MNFGVIFYSMVMFQRPPQSTNFIFQKRYENFSHGVLGLVGSHLSVIIMRKRMRNGYHTYLIKEYYL